MTQGKERIGGGQKVKLDKGNLDQLGEVRVFYKMTGAKNF